MEVLRRKSGWTLAVLSHKRRLLNMIPKQGCFDVVFTFSEKAAEAVRKSDLPQSVIDLIPADTQCVCGYGVTLNVNTSANINAVKKLLEIKHTN